MTIDLSHFEIRTRDLPLMEAFYTGALGFLATDRSADATMVFLSADPGEHHQIVLAQAADGDFASGSLDHLAFRVADLAALRRYHEALRGYGDLAVETVSHGTSWSVYFRDPEGNRLELFVDTPWHVAQPLRFPVDLSMPDDELIAWTRERISGHADFQPAADWFGALEGRLGKAEPDR